ncbi:MAG: hypothetical protein AAGF44_05395 [Pseudomonadota bacterium]
MGQIDEATLVRILDGTASDAEEEAVAEAMALDPGLSARLDALSPNLAAFREGMDALLTQAPAVSIPIEAPRARPLWHYVAAAVLLFSLGVAVGRAVPDPAADWHQAVADYQALYTTATLTAVPLSPAMRETGLAETSAALGLELTSETIAAPGLSFQRAQILEVDGAPLAQLVYLDTAGQPVAFCITRRSGAARPAETARFGSQTARIWRQNGWGFILIGEVSEGQLRAAERDLIDKIAL